MVVLRYLVNLVHSVLLHPALGLCYRWSPAWLLRLHDRTARYAWPETKGLLPNGDLPLIRRALRDAKFALWLHKTPSAKEALVLCELALRTLPEPAAERYDQWPAK